MTCDYCSKEGVTKKIVIMRRDLSICPGCEVIRGRVNKGVDKKKSKFKVSVKGRKFEVL